MKIAFVFPGQGSQFVGMGQELYNNFSTAKHVFQEVDEALAQNLSKIIFEGPQEELTLTENTQPALMAVSLAVVAVFEKEFGGKVEYAEYLAGHSLGEYSAIAAAGAISISETARLLKIRGQAMQKAVPVGTGAMIALLGADLELARTIAEQSKCDIANDNCPGQIVLSGAVEAIAHASQIASEHSKKAINLPVSAPFHSQLMIEAQTTMEGALQHANILTPKVPIVTNVTAQPTRDPESLRTLLVKQVTGMVRWRETINYLSEQKITHIIELGAGKVLAGLVKRTNKDITTLSVHNPEEIEELAKLCQSPQYC
jgi:[acyl-carrier-protein] S-malonyltransferase